MTNKQKNFEIGYRHGIQGRDIRQDLVAFPGYADGYDAGHCDMPTMEERYPLDIAKERSTGCLS